jgi:hypothetical protein
LDVGCTRPSLRSSLWRLLRPIVLALPITGRHAVRFRKGGADRTPRGGHRLYASARTVLVWPQRKTQREKPSTSDPEITHHGMTQRQNGEPSDIDMSTARTRRATRATQWQRQLAHDLQFSSQRLAALLVQVPYDPDSSSNCLQCSHCQPRGSTTDDPLWFEHAGGRRRDPVVSTPQ